MEIVAEGLAFPEGPIALADGSVLLVEIRAGTLSHIGPTGRRRVVAELGGGPNGAAIGPDGAVYVCNNGGSRWVTRRDGIVIPHGLPDDYAGGSIQRVEVDTGRTDTLYRDCDGRVLRAPNDLVFDGDGGFWFTDLGKSDGDRMDFGHVYYARADGSGIRHVRGGLVTPNGIALSPDGRHLHVAETRTSRVWTFSILGPGEIASPRYGTPSHDVLGPLPGDVWLDSMAVELSGRICVATVNEGGVAIFDPNTRQHEFLAVPDPVTTNICFGGEDLQDAYITASSSGRLYRQRWPRPGLPLAYR